MNPCPSCQAQYPDEIPICPSDGSLLGAPVLDGRYKLLGKVGEGGMGWVYAAEHVALRKRVAIKVLRGAMAKDPQLSARFEQEAIAASQIGHEHIVSVTDFGHMPDGALYYAMEYLDGQTLAALLRRERPLAIPRALGLLSQIAGALGAAHERGIVHRDLKPGNVMVLAGDEGERVKVLDFGVSKITRREAGAAPLTEQGAILGTAEYMSPEQASGAEVDARADVYALGVMAYEMVTGTLPFQGEHSVATLFKHMQEAVDPPSRRAPQIALPAPLEGLILRCLAKKPADRPANMAQVRAELGEIRKLLGGEVSGIQPAPPVPPAPAPAPVDPESIAPTLFRARARSRARRWWLAGGAAVALLGGGAWIASRALSTEPVHPERSEAESKGQSAEHVDPAGLQTGSPGASTGSARTGSEGSPSPGSEGFPPAGSAGSARTGSSDPVHPERSEAESKGQSAEHVDPVGSTGASTGSARTGLPSRVTLRTVPPGAAVYRGKARLGTTPLEIDRPAPGSAPLRLVLAGYAATEVDVLPPGDELELRLEKSARRRQTDKRPARKTDDVDRVDDLKSPYP